MFNIVKYFLLTSVIFSLPYSSVGKAQSKVDPQLQDYLVQDICLAPTGKIIQVDPAFCLNRRNIGVGEASPYLRSDRNIKNGDTYSAFTSVPMEAGSGVDIVTEKDMHGHFNSNFIFAFDFNKDGYDGIKVNNLPFASIVRTRDANCHEQAFASRASPKVQSDLPGGWILFPNSSPIGWSASEQLITANHHIQISSNVNSSCHNGQSLGLTKWYSPIPVKYESGKTLLSIRSDHYAAVDLGQKNNALERFYFTREYGFSRWEAWVPLGRCLSEHAQDSEQCSPEAPNNILAPRCSSVPKLLPDSTGRAVWGQQVWVRTDCRDETFYIPLNTPQHIVPPPLPSLDGKNN